MEGERRFKLVTASEAVIPSQLCLYMINLIFFKDKKIC